MLTFTRGLSPLNPMSNTIFLWFSYGFPMLFPHFPMVFFHPLGFSTKARTWLGRDPSRASASRPHRRSPALCLHVYRYNHIKHISIYSYILKTSYIYIYIYIYVYMQIMHISFIAITVKYKYIHRTIAKTIHKCV